MDGAVEFVDVIIIGYWSQKEKSIAEKLPYVELRYVGAPSFSIPKLCSCIKVSNNLCVDVAPKHVAARHFIEKVIKLLHGE